MRKLAIAAMVRGALLVQASGASADALRVAQRRAARARSPAPRPSCRQGSGELGEGPRDHRSHRQGQGDDHLEGAQGRTVTIEVRDRQKLDVVKVGDPVVATYMEAVVIQAVKADGAPGVTTQETRMSSKPGENPAGAIGREVTVTATITAIDRKAQTVTIKGPQGGTETIKAKDPKNVEKLKVGDIVDITYAQALAVALDKPASNRGTQHRADGTPYPGEKNF